MRNVESISSLDDPRISAYRNLKDRELARGGNRFIAEGEHLVRRLLASDFPVESVLLASRRAAEIVPLVDETVPVYVMPDPIVNQVVGFKFHSGVIACGRRKAGSSLKDLIGSLPPRATLVICPDINNSENLGSLIRLAAGFGADGMILGPECCDPFFRRSIRVSMGAVFQLNLYQSSDLMADLRRLSNEWQFDLAAAVLDESAEPLSGSTRGQRLALLFGNEAQGLSRDIMAACHRRITIPMHLGTDSLNVSVAAGVFLYHFCSYGRPGP
jgi:tRNA G18 (ribose-2'-O)-methylase SpoU